MALRVSLVLDGDADGLKKAADDSSRAILDLGQLTDRISQSIESGFDKAAGKLGDYKKKSEGVTVANDNVAQSGIAVANSLGTVTSKIAGADTAIGKLSASAGSIASGIASLGRVATPMGLLAGALGLAITLATTFFGILDSKSPTVEATLQEHARLVGVIRDAYKDAANKAGDFLQQSKNVTLFQTQRNLIGLRDELASVSGKLSSGLALGAGLPGAVQPGDQLSSAETQAIQKAIDDLQASVARGRPDIVAFREAITNLGIAAAASNPALAEYAAGLLKASDNAADLANKVARGEAILRLIGGTASETDRKLLGLSTSTNDAGEQFEKFLKSASRQAAAMEAESKSVGLSAGAAARLRAETTLLEAAHQAGGKTAETYAGKIAAIADRYGEAAQKAAEARLRSDAAFERAQLGRNASEGAIADRLRSVYGDNFEAELNGSIASTMRLTEQLRVGKEASVEFLSGLARDAGNGVKPLDALNNALGRLSNRLIDMAINNLVSKAFGPLVSGITSGGSPLSLSPSGSGGSGVSYGTPGGTGGILGGFFDVGGYTGDLPTKAVAGVVHGREFVINAWATARHRPLLEAINDNRVPGYESGGYVGSPPPALPGRGAAAMVPMQLNVQIINATGTSVKATQQQPGPGFDMAIMLESIDEGMAQKVADGDGKLSKVLTGQFGLQRSFG